MTISIILICGMIFPSYATFTSSDGSFFGAKVDYIGNEAKDHNLVIQLISADIY